MTVVAVEPADLGSWEAAFCTGCRREMDPRVLVDLDAEPGGYDGDARGPHVVHLTATPPEGPGDGPTECGWVREAIWSGRFLVEVGTGEVLAVEQPEGFAVRDRASAEWVLERIFDAEADDAALEERKRILVRNIERMQEAQRRRAAWLRRRFEPELREWARAELEGKRGRTIRTPFGTLSFRKGRRRVVVEDEDGAVAWARRHRPEAVRVEERLLVSRLAEGDSPDGCRIVPPEDAFEIRCVPGPGRS